MKTTADWIYFSPHFDDAVLSCGGLIFQQIQTGFRVEIWTVTAAPNPYPDLSPFAQEHHERWKTGRLSVQARQQEDQAACQCLGAGWRHLPFYDCLYRKKANGAPLVSSNRDLFRLPETGELDEAEKLLYPDLSDLPQTARLVSPLGIGNHRDHWITRMLLEKHFKNLYYYSEFPYSADIHQNLNAWVQGMNIALEENISLSALQAWQNAAACYRSQISTFWKSKEVMYSELEKYLDQGSGRILWQKTPV